MTSPTTTGVTGFQFITSVNTIKRDDETRKKVRSHARRQKLPNEPASKQQPPAQQKAGQKERVSKFRVNARASTTPVLAKRHALSVTALPANEIVPALPSPAESSTLSDTSSGTDQAPKADDELTEEIKVEWLKDDWQSDVIPDKLAAIVATELPCFSVLPIRTTPLTDKLFDWMACVCLSRQEKKPVQQYFDRNGVPDYFRTYHSSFQALAHVMNPEGNWFEFVRLYSRSDLLLMLTNQQITVDPGMTHGFMGLVAAMHCALVGWEDNDTRDFHRYEAVRYINKRLVLEGKDDARISDGVVVAVSLLVQVESFIGSLSSARAHLMGLLKMVELRGGIEDGFGCNVVLQRALARADFAYATAAQCPLSFPFLPASASTLSVQNRFLSRSAVLNTSWAGARTCRLTIQTREAIELFELLRSTTEAVNDFKFNRTESTRADRVQISDSVYMLEYRLCNLEQMIRCRARGLLAPSPVQSPSDPFMAAYDHALDISDALVYASHLYLDMALRAQPPQAPGNRLLVKALMTSLNSAVNCMSPTVIKSSATVEPFEDGRVPGYGMEATQYYTPITWVDGSVGDQGTKSDGTPDSSSRESHDELFEDILCWILFVGSCVQIPTSGSWHCREATVDCHRFFLDSLQRQCWARGISTLEVLKRKLSHIVWLDSWCERQLEMIWAQIGAEYRV